MFSRLARSGELVIAELSPTESRGFKVVLVKLTPEEGRQLAILSSVLEDAEPGRMKGNGSCNVSRGWNVSISPKEIVRVILLLQLGETSIVSRPIRLLHAFNFSPALWRVLVQQES